MRQPKLTHAIVSVLTKQEYKQLLKFARDSGMEYDSETVRYCVTRQLIKEGYLKGKKGVEK